jgi:hypothetical protein
MQSDRNRPATLPLPPPGSPARPRPHLTLVYCRDRDGPPTPARPQRSGPSLVTFAALLVATAGLAAAILTL